MIIKPPETLNFVVVDPSLRSSGVLICRDGKISTYAIEKKDPEKYPRLWVLGYYIKHFANLAKERDWDFLLIENYSFGSQSRSVTVAAEIGGIIRACFASYNIPILEMENATWKSITGIRMKKASVQDKREYRNAVLEKFGMDITTTDEIDAYLMFYSLAMISRGEVKKGIGSNIRERLEKMKIRI
jgi:hypothetical protein